MAIKRVDIFVGDDMFDDGKPFNVYDTYAHALARAATGLSTIYDIDALTGSQGSAISQTAKTAGVSVDQRGWIHFMVDNASPVYIVREGAFTPIVVGTGQMG